MRRTVTAAVLALVSVTAAQAALVVSKAPTGNVDCVGGVCTATAADATMNVKQLRRLLNKHNVTLVSGSMAQDIVVETEVTWATAHALLFDAFRGIEFDFAVTSEGTGGVTLTTNDGGSGGDYAFANKGKLAFWDTASTLTINGESYTLVDSPQSLIDAVNATPGGRFAFTRFYDATNDHPYLEPIPNLAGIFTGLGHTIEGLSMSPGKGFFQATAPGATIRDLTLSDAKMTGKDSVWGAIFVGQNGGLVTHVSVVNGLVRFPKNSAELGLLVWKNAGTIRSCNVSGIVNAQGAVSEAGGLAFQNTDTGSIVDARADVAVTASLEGGGLVADNLGSISRSSSGGSVTMRAPKSKIRFLSGGLVAANRDGGAVDRSYSTAIVNGGTGNRNFGHVFPYAGGLVGQVLGGTVTNSYSRGPVTVGALAHAAGFAGLGDGFTASYATGTVSASDPGDEAGFAWQTDRSVSGDYWDVDTTGQATACHHPNTCPGLTGLTTAQFQSGLPAGFDPQVWAQSPGVNDGYPYLIDNPPQ